MNEQSPLLDDDASLLAAEKRSTYVEEARFGLRYIAPFVSGLGSGARVLEVGSGPGLLLSELAALRPDIELRGIEPCSGGFEFFEALTASARAQHSKLEIHMGGYESYSEGGTFELIYCVNVLEHLPDWRDFLQFLTRRLSPQGRAVILAPNYAFPYEAHFGIPIIINKALTGRLFAKHITLFEEANNCSGLWDSLNFVRYGEVLKACAESGLVIASDSRICIDLIERLDTDTEFAERHRWLRYPARWLCRMRLLRCAVKWPYVLRVLPYMLLDLRPRPRTSPIEV